MLDAHPELAIPPETQFIPLAARNCESSRDPSKSFERTLTSHLHWQDFHIPRELFRERVNGIVPFRLGDALRTFYRIYAERFGKRRWGDKTPRYVLDMELIQRLLPEVHFIHVLRDGRDVALSVIRERKRPSFSPQAMSDAIRKGAEHWVGKITEARRQADILRFYREVRYEDLVLDSESTLKGICEFIELPWNDVMLEYYKTAEQRLAELVTFNPRKVKSIEEHRARHSLTRRAPDASRIGRWKKEMNNSDRQTFEAIAGAILSELGYETGSPRRN
jgi:hypothetical protein